MNKKIVIAIVFACVFLLVQIGSVHAIKKDQKEAVEGIEDTIGNVVDLIQLIAGSIGALVLTAGGIMFMVSGESPEKKDQAKQILTMGVIGMVIIFAGPWIAQFIVS
jgi:hypothetical protein